VIVGAGAAGLAAMRELDRAGCTVLCLEARNRIGGRIYTTHDPLLPVPIELGAEFVHGRPRATWKAIEAARLNAYEIAGRPVHMENGEVRERGGTWERIGRVMDDLRRAADACKDQTFQEFIERAEYPEETKQMATAYVEGFNAARKEIVSIASLACESQAAARIDGDRSFRILNGYEAVPKYLLHSVENWRERLRLNSIVERIRWKRGAVEVTVRGAEPISAQRAIVTVPLGVLQEGGIRFDPEPIEALEAARKLAFGQVVRIVLRFREPFWREKQAIADAGFLLSTEKRFPTWWTSLPVESNMLVGWSAGPRADDLLGKTKAEIVAEGIAALARILGQKRERVEGLLEQAYYHDWHADPFARGAYSYAPAGACSAREALAKPIEETLFFAGEAAETEGYCATVHGAILSGREAARKVREVLR
jgi:monoamine oxidase